MLDGGDKKFRDEPVVPVFRHWLCPCEGCEGEMISTGYGLSTATTEWQHRCNKCSHKAWARHSYPTVINTFPSAWPKT